MMLDDLLDHLKKPHGRLYLNDQSLGEFMEAIGKAERFSFENLPLELADETDDIGDYPRKSAYRIPRLTKDELEFWQEGLIPLPSPTCWYEFEIGGVRSALLVITVNGRVHVQRVEYVKAKGNESAFVLIDGVWATLGTDGNALINSVNTELLNHIKTKSASYISLNYAANPEFMIYLTLMINSQTTEVRKWTPDAASNRLRRLRGKLPMQEHRIVNLVPKKYIVTDRPKGEKGGWHPRLHWRRSHVRTYHKGEPGEYKRVVARMLVGKRELGEISHEYRVRSV